jgi:uracil-DNA glycosylase family 4
MAKLSTFSLEDLYSREKKTRAVELAIIEKSDFSKINEQYCTTICKLKCKTNSEVPILTSQVDVLIIQDHRSPDGKFDRKPGQQDYIQAGVIDFIAKNSGLKGLTYRVTSLLKCAASKEDFPAGKPPTQTVLQKCFPYLHQELVATKPKVIISLGTATTKALGLSTKSNTGNRGEIAFSQYGPVVITLHPRILTYIRQNARGAAGMWGPDYLKVIERDFEKARKVATGEIKYTASTLKESVAEIERSRIKIARSLEDVSAIVKTIDDLDPNAVISFDTETTSLDPLDTTLRLLTIQFGWRDVKTGQIRSGVIPLYHRDNKAYDADMAWDILSPILTGPRAKVGHNSKFDILVIYWSKKVRVRNVKFDTLLMLHSLESGTQGCYGLKAACWDHLADKGYAGYENELGDIKKLIKLREKEALLEGGDGDTVVKELENAMD